MDQVAQFVGYPESEFEEESDGELQPPRSQSYGGSKLSPSGTLKSTPHVRSTNEESTAKMDHSAAPMQKNRPLASNTSKTKANSKDMKRM